MKARKRGSRNVTATKSPLENVLCVEIFPLPSPFLVSQRVAFSRPLSRICVQPVIIKFSNKFLSCQLFIPCIRISFFLNFLKFLSLSLSFFVCIKIEKQVLFKKHEWRERTVRAFRSTLIYIGRRAHFTTQNRLERALEISSGRGKNVEGIPKIKIK